MNETAPKPPEAADMGRRFAELHETATFVMPNVADAATAVAVREAGAVAIATTSSGHALTIGRRDAAGDVALDEHAEHAALLVRSAGLPCNVDAENGYGHEPEAMAIAVNRIAATGAAGMGIEDWSGDNEIGFYDTELAIARIKAAVEAANALDRPFIVTGRSDLMLYGDDRGLREVRRRLDGFEEAGAHCVYAPGIGGVKEIGSLVERHSVAVNVLVPFGRPPWWPTDQPLPTLATMADLGVRRISLGGSLFGSQIRHAASLVAQVLAGHPFDT